MPCLPISGSTTAYGRKMIMDTREHVTQKYTRANGWVGHDLMDTMGGP